MELDRSPGQLSWTVQAFLNDSNLGYLLDADGSGYSQFDTVNTTVCGTDLSSNTNTYKNLCWLFTITDSRGKINQVAYDCKGHFFFHTIH